MSTIYVTASRDPETKDSTLVAQGLLLFLRLFVIFMFYV